MRALVDLCEIVVQLGSCPACGEQMHRGGDNPQGWCKGCLSRLLAQLRATRLDLVALAAVAVAALDDEDYDPRPDLTDVLSGFDADLIQAARARAASPVALLARKGYYMGSRGERPR